MHKLTSYMLRCNIICTSLIFSSAHSMYLLFQNLFFPLHVQFYLGAPYNFKDV